MLAVRNTVESFKDTNSATKVKVKVNCKPPQSPDHNQRNQIKPYRQSMSRIHVIHTSNQLPFQKFPCEDPPGTSRVVSCSTNPQNPNPATPTHPIHHHRGSIDTQRGMDASCGSLDLCGQSPPNPGVRNIFGIITSFFFSNTPLFRRQ